ncbi:hypothetical protein ES703_57849 [subsurface metagenome]
MRAEKTFRTLKKAETPFGVRINIPKNIREDFKLKNGDVLEWYPTYLGMDVPDSEIIKGNVIIILIRRGKNQH